MPFFLREIVGIENALLRSLVTVAYELAKAIDPKGQGLICCDSCLGIEYQCMLRPFRLIVLAAGLSSFLVLFCFVLFCRNCMGADKQIVSRLHFFSPGV